MKELLKTWVLIAALRAKPQDLPGDKQSLQVAVVAAFASYLLAVALMSDGSLGLQRAVFDIGLAAISFYVVLNVIGKSERFIQAFSAYCGSSVILNLASMVLLPSLGQEPAATDGSAPGVFQYMEFLFLVWSITVLAHIIRFTFETGIALSILFSTGYLVLYISLMNALLVI